jgi:hypothetical protein
LSDCSTEKESRAIASDQTSSLPATPGESATKVERRTWVRYPQNRDADCHPAASKSGVHWPARVHDISATGVGLIVHYRFEPGTLLAVDLQSTTGDVVRTVLVRVVHLTVMSAHPGLRWLAGCAFLTQLSEEDLQALL